MKPSEIKKLVERLLAERLNELGYFKEKSLNDFFVKSLSDDLKIGVFPKLTRRHGDWQIKFDFGIHYSGLERQLDAFGGSALRASFNGPWTIIRHNLKFPNDYCMRYSFEPSIGQVGGVHIRNNMFASDMDEQAVIDRVNINLAIIEKYSLPWLSTVDKDTVLRELQSGAGYDQIRILLSHYLADDLEKVEVSVRNCKNNVYIANHEFFENVLRACEEKRGLGIDASRGRQSAGDELSKSTARTESLLNELFDKQLNAWGYYKEPDEPGLFKYIKRGSRDVANGIWLDLKALPTIWRFALFFANAFEPIECEIDLLGGNELRGHMGRWTISRHLDNTFPEDYRYSKRFSEIHGCVVFDANQNEDCPRDLDDETIIERAKSYLAMVQKYCIPALERVVDLDTVLEVLHESRSDDIRHFVAHYIANDFDKVEELVNSYRSRQTDVKNHPFWNNLLQAGKEKRAFLRAQG